MRDRLFAVSIVFFAFAGCRNETPVAKDVTDEKVEPVAAEEMKSLVRGNTEFAFALYNEAREKPGNVVFSPYSISSALAMTYDGARGETAQQMANVLHFPPDRKQLHPAFRELNGALTKRSDGLELSIANALWGQKGMTFHTEFLDATRTFYGAGVQEVDYIRAQPVALKTINNWVNRETRTKIPTILQPNDLTVDTRLVLTNAIYLKGQWATAFKKDATRPADFLRKPDDSVLVPTMHHAKAEFPYAAIDGVEVLELPYRGNKASMVVILPGPSYDLADLERSLSAEKLAVWLSKLHPAEMRVSLPRFKIELELRLNENLKKMGMPLAFAGGFSGMTSEASLCISAVIHKALVEVDEEGTVAAAATAVVMGEKSERRTTHFNANRPFIFLIRDRTTDSVLFVGRVTDPSATK